MRLTNDGAPRESDGSDNESVRDLTFGIGPKHIRALCDNSWEGGNQYTPKQVGDMTLDQIFMLLADRKILRGTSKVRTEQRQSLAIVSDDDGFVKGRDQKGRPIKAKIKGESLASRIRREAKEKKEAQESN